MIFRCLECKNPLIQWFGEQLEHYRCLNCGKEFMAEEQEFKISSTGGKKEVKREAFALIPVEALEALARVYGVGSEKYEEHNWRRGYNWSLSYSALQRHLNAFWRGEEIDSELQLPHIMQAAWHCFTLYIFSLEQRDFDDRFRSQISN